MKLIIEDKDIAEVKRMTEERYDVFLTDEQVREVIEGDSYLAMQLFDKDIESETLSNALVDWLMNDGYNHPSKWRWPCYGDKQQYKDHFYKTFKIAVGYKNLKLGPSWDNK